MLALARALMSAPRILLIDEPSVGLAPLLVSRTIDKIKELKEGFDLTTVLMADKQNFTRAIRIADRGYVIVHGHLHRLRRRFGRGAEQQQRPDPRVLPRSVNGPSSGRWPRSSFRPWGF